MPQERKAPSDVALMQRKQENTTLVRVEAGATIADMVNGVEGAPRMITNLDLNSPSGKIMMLNATGTADYDVDKLGGEAVPVTYWMAQVATVNDENKGTLVQCPRVTFFDQDGKFIAFTSWAIARYLDAMRMAFGDGPYQPAIKLSFQRVSAGKGQQSYNVKLVVE